MIKKIVKENWIYLLIIFLLILIYYLVFNSKYYDSIMAFDNKFIKSINAFRSDSMTSIFKIITVFGDFYIPFIILVCILLFIKNKWIFTLQVGGYSIAGIITYLSKVLIKRPRPVSALIEIPSSYSFPSGHTLTSILFYVLLVYLLTYNCKKEVRRSSIILISIFTFLIAFSRPYLGVHYLSDIIGGIILSIPTLLMIINIINKNFSKKLSGK